MKHNALCKGDERAILQMFTAVSSVAIEKIFSTFGVQSALRNVKGNEKASKL